MVLAIHSNQPEQVHLVSLVSLPDSLSLVSLTASLSLSFPRPRPPPFFVPNIPATMVEQAMPIAPIATCTQTGKETHACQCGDDAAFPHPIHPNQMNYLRCTIRFVTTMVLLYGSMEGLRLAYLLLFLVIFIFISPAS